MRILLVEDEEEIAAFIVKALKSEGYSVDRTPSGKKGVFWAKTNDYDLIILDIMLPDINGFSVCKEIRQVKKKIPILMLTVKSEINDKVKAFDIGADDYLTKPFAIEELLVRIKALFRRPQNILQDIYRIKDLVIDVRKHIVTKNGETVELRPKEFSLLEYLLRNQGTVLSRSMLLEHVWDMNTDPFTNTVDVHIRSLRQKLDDPKGKIIETVHGKGYKIRD